MIRALLYATGATDATLFEHLAAFNKTWDDLINRVPGGRFLTLGEKPQPGDKSIRYYLIPGSNLAIRIWNGNMEESKQFCLDFFDVNQDIAVNTPHGHVLWNCSCLSQQRPEEQLVSWEKAFQIEIIHPGEERYSVLEGAFLVLTRLDMDPFYFQIPFRPFVAAPGFAQPQATI
ncbi:hypothetical protein L210DRAFT_911995 [Boletus edulis BED1]|uniref:Uncharacterized protein n=1 Tax=Boletus edulis BED1 TaxID=1328754 RepID=A0AAD4C3E9_BOLED|nr:hypothetical protein L210DRAFT_911995 [Boletus edulis BED1]